MEVCTTIKQITVLFSLCISIAQKIVKAITPALGGELLHDL